MPIYYGVYRVLKNGKHDYVSRSCTSNKKLAEEIARDLSEGLVMLPAGNIKRVVPHPHIAKEMCK